VVARPEAAPPFGIRMVVKWPRTRRPGAAPHQTAPNLHALLEHIRNEIWPTYTMELMKVVFLAEIRAGLTPAALGNTLGVQEYYVANPMRTVSFKLPERLDDALSELARRRNSSRSALVREALEALAKGKRRSVTALADEVAPGVEGPADLSSNKKHMAGYGK
jgi:predicted transcriptional regulator